MRDVWNTYFCNVNNRLASIFLNLGLREHAPIPGKPWLLWVWVYFKTPRPDGLSDSNEAPQLFKIEDRLNEELKSGTGAIFAGRITTLGRREFYYYGERDREFQRCVSEALKHFPGYKFDCGAQKEPDWNQYFKVLYPGDEDLQRMKNRDVLDVLEREGDVHTVEREVTHWVYFTNEYDRQAYLAAITELGYTKSQLLDGEDPRPLGLTFFRHQAVTSDLIDEAVIELFRLAQQHRAEYDGWETRVEKG